MARVARGDVDAFASIVRTHQARVVRFAFGMLGDRDAAQDAAQETFVRLWRARERYRSQGALASFLLRLTRNVCLDYGRADRAHPEALLDDRCAGGAQDGPSERVALGDALHRALAILPGEQREVFLLSEQEGLTYKEIAGMLDCPVGTVASRKAAAMETLRHTLGPWLRGDE